MMLSDLALLELTMQRDSVMLTFRRFIRRLFRRELTRNGEARSRDRIMLVQAELLGSAPVPPPDEDGADPPAGNDVTAGQDTATRESFRWRRHPQLLQRTHQGELDRASRTQAQREARSAAVQGMYLTRGGRYEEAQACFVRAARDEAINLAEIPGFWSLSRSEMQTVIDAYEVVGRLRDSSALSAKLRTMYRPRVVTAPRVTPIEVAHSPSSWKQTASE